jgi:hypothetical protein
MSKAVIKLGKARAFALALPGAKLWWGRNVSAMRVDLRRASPELVGDLLEAERPAAFQQPASVKAAGATAIIKSPPVGDARTSRLPSASPLTAALTPPPTLIWPVTSGGT